MPAINVAKTDTFEIQRQKINQIGNQIFNISQGGSDLSTGNLKLGDGTRTAPSLAFISNPSLGLYKAAPNTFGFVSSGKKIADYSVDDIYSYRNFIIQKNILSTEGIFVLNTGLNYDAGTYTNVPLLGGTGDSATANIVVTEFVGTVNNFGSNYNEGTYQNISLIGGNSSGTIVSFEVDGISGLVLSGGSGYIPATYNNVPLINGSGSGATANITVEGDTILNGSITSSGSGYTEGSYDIIEILNTPVETFTVTTIANPGTPPPDNVYQINGNTQQVLTLIKGNTYRFDLSDSTNSGHPLIFQTSLGGDLSELDYYITSKGTPGEAGSFVDLIIKPSAQTETIKYNCQFHDGMGANISIVDGASTRYGSSAFATITVDASGVVTNLSFSSSGIDYKQGDTLQIYSGDVGGTGSGFVYTLSALSYTGTVTQVNIQNNGQNYASSDVLSANTSDLGGVGSGFSYTITSNPGVVKNLSFTSKNSGYQVGDLLSLPEEVTNVQTILKGEVLNVSTTLSDASSIINVTSTSGIVSGMNVTADIIGSTGNVSPGTTVLSVDSSTQITLSQNPSTSGEAILNFVSPGELREIELLSTDNIIIGSLVTKVSGDGILEANTIVEQINAETNIITLSNAPLQAGSVVLEFTPPFGVPTNKFEYEILKLGAIESIDISSGGNAYSLSDILTVDNKDLAQPIVLPVINRDLQVITFVDNVSSTVFSVGDSITLAGGDLLAPVATIYDIKSSGGFIQSMLVDESNFSSGDTITGESISTAEYDINTASNTTYRFFINVGNGFELTPNFTLYSGNTYIFDLSDNSNSGHIFSLSKFRDGIWGPSFIENVSSTLDSSSSQISVLDTTGILPGMEVVLQSGSGELDLNTKVLEVQNLTTVILDKLPVSSGEVTLNFRGVEYTDGVERSSEELKIQVTDTTPNLYYYCGIQNDIHINEGGEDNVEAILTVDLNNPKIFGSDFSIRVDELSTQDIIKNDVLNGEISAVSFTGTELTVVDATVSSDLTATKVLTPEIDTSLISSENTIAISSPSVEVQGNLSIGSQIQITASNGNITTTGLLQINGSLNVDNLLTINDNNISTSSGNDLIFSPATGRLTKINSSSALVIPSGSSLQRPSSALAVNGSIRFNIDNGQYEGYSETSSTWSSLGGVRDIDNNTYIEAEAFTGANDNILYFYNDSQNTLKLTRNYLDFNTVKKLRSLDVNLPTYTEWSSNSPVTLGDYIKYRNNIYEVTQTGTTGTSGTEPTHTSGSQANGTSVLAWYSSAVSPLTFEEIQELRIGPNGDLPLVINGDLRLFDNVISTDINDLLLQPNDGKKVTVNANTSLVIPVGDINQRGAPSAGSIRYNTTIAQFEGYSGTNWSSLGGVRDVDGNTYIIPETLPGSNENTLYFYNDNVNTLSVTTTALDFIDIDTVRSVNSNSLHIEASLVTFDNISFSIENSESSTFISSTKDNLDIGLSQGLNNDPVLRLENTGDIYYNIGFGTGTYNGIKIFDSELKELEIADFKISTSKINLVKGSVNNGSAILYNPAINESAKVQVIAHNTTTGDKEFIEYSVIDNGIDIFFTEYNNLKTGEELISSVFDFTSENNVRITFNVSDLLTNGDNLIITVISNIIKR